MIKNNNIPFNRPFVTGKELSYIVQAINEGRLSGDGLFTQKCHTWLEQRLGCKKALLTHSGTAALEMTAILSGIQRHDEVIMPSYTFVSTANAFVLRGGVPVFVDIRPDTLNIDETKIEAAITRNTKVIVPVHYAGVACEMDSIMRLADKYKLTVIEDAAHGILSSYKGQALGSIGHMAALSFHETKNIISGEGGALLLNNRSYVERAEIIREKGTNRNNFYRKQVDKYTWVDIGSSFLPSDIVAAFLWAQMEEANEINRQRLKIWSVYHHALENAERQGLIRRPFAPSGCQHNTHMYYVILSPGINRKAVLEDCRENGIGAVFHYVPLHRSFAGQKYGRTHGDLSVTESVAERLIRLPLWIGLTMEDQHRIIEILIKAVSKSRLQSVAN